MNIDTADHTTPPGHILIVEDEQRIVELIRDYLEAAGFTTEIIRSGLDVLSAVHRHSPTLIVMDVMLPGYDGITLCHEIRQFSDVPIVLLTARTEEIDRLIGLESGADDYVCKPFSPRELVARIKIILRRALRSTQGTSPAPLSPPFGSQEGLLVLDAHRQSASVKGQNLDLTAVEFRLLATLASAPGRIFSRAQLLEKLHDDSRPLSDRTIDSHIKNVRRKMKQIEPEMEFIHSVYGAGYKAEIPGV